jgi:hypothetical protein
MGDEDQHLAVEAEPELHELALGSFPAVHQRYLAVPSDGDGREAPAFGRGG